MALLPIVVYPDPVLLKPTRRVERFDQEFHDLIQDMAETMYAASGVGLAANQVGVDLRVFIVDESAGERPDSLLVFANPEIIDLQGTQCGEEGCLSFPDLMLEVERADRATVQAQDIDGKSFTYTGEGLMARAIQHESEHLDGQVFLRNLSSIKRELVKKQIKKRIKAGDWMAAVAG
jgi:peptide deformylase